MLSTFTSRGGRTLIVRSEDVRRLEDHDDASALLVWMEGGERITAVVDGTALENLERLKQQELQLIAEHEARQARVAQGLPALPVPRGRPQR